jgi:bacterioferritin (cytochrome b1)
MCCHGGKIFDTIKEGRDDLLDQQRDQIAQMGIQNYLANQMGE